MKTQPSPLLLQCNENAARSAVFAGQDVGVKEVADHVWLISFMDFDLGFFDDQCNRVECAPNPFGAKVLPMSPE